MPFLVHPLLVHFPVALWLTSFLFDLLSLRTSDRFYATASRYLIGLGVLGAVGAIITGFVDYLPLRAQGVGQTFIDRHRTHSLLAYVVTAVYAGIFLLRWRKRGPAGGVAVALAGLGAVLIAITAYLGGEIRRVM
ncbi:MAG: DUF2231 domain-containing protein [Armatimonadota bacterium]|nr:DUF2231 domain-containing protein [Armatimonadota bacterium]MDR7452388.1 DUF2231 domain-containing protein [Armatimonadota bacterium]MDR7466733.1 DUF2231 domain-containing protein [Armatimonadota bacterium]MDR7492793.1 DUF2231 domain-containing protein [Armatimonadota bacterium]MDR7498569.1 DUF2231 domain-containing protein [Armatimonadota bacterium]